MSISLISILTGEVFPVTDIMINGDQDSRVNIVFLGDGYTQEEMNDYIDDVGEVGLVREKYLFSSAVPLVHHDGD